MFLVESGAQHSGPLFTSIRSPLIMSKAMKLDEIQHLFEEDGAHSDEQNALIQTMDCTFSKRVSNASPNNGKKRASM